MVAINEAVRSGVEKYLDRLRQEIPVEKAMLFGSYARGTFDSGRDIDLDLEPWAFTYDEYIEPASGTSPPPRLRYRSGHGSRA